MKSPEAMVAYLAEQIGLMYYHNPLMYGGRAAGVELLLRAYHEAWAFLVEYDGDWRQVWWNALEREDCGSADFSTYYAMNHPDATEQDTVAYVIKHWRPVTAQLGVPIPHAALEAEFKSWREGRPHAP